MEEPHTLMDDELRRNLRYLELVEDANSPDLLALRDEVSLRDLMQHYNPAHVFKLYFSTGKVGPWSAAYQLNARTKLPFTFHRTWGAWEGKLEWSCMVEFICNPRSDPYPTTLRSTLKLANWTCVQYNQDAALVTYEGANAKGMRTWLVEKEGGDE